MDNNSWLLLSIFVIGTVALTGFFVTKTKGFGRFATSTFLLLLVVILSGLLYAGGKLDAQLIANIFFAVTGFAGGLFTGKFETESQKPDTKNNHSQDKV